MRVVLLALLGWLLNSSCAATAPRWEAGRAGSESEARALLDGSLDAVRGPEALRSIEVEYEGEWGFWVRQIQPEITDAGYRQRSRDRLEPGADRIEQTHTGEAGVKYVQREGQETRVQYDGQRDGQREGEGLEVQAAALVAEAYQLFLLGPRYLDAHESGLRMLESRREDGRTYERLVARLRPGLGDSEEDVVELWVDAETALPHRVHFTLEGFPSTRGAHADTTYMHGMRVEGHWFPVEFRERVRGPLRLFAHEWRTSALSFD